MLSYIAEFLGTMILITLGNGVVASVTLNKLGMKGAGSIQITSAWDLAVMLPAFIFGATSGAHFNPTLTITLTVDGSTAWGPIPRYAVVQFTGAFVDAVVVYLLFKDRYDVTESATTKLRTFCTGPSVLNMGRSILSEAVGTFALILVIKDIDQITGTTPGVDKLLVFGIIVSIGMSLGGLTGYAINPTRNLGLRLAHAILPIRGKGDSNWGYALVAIIGSTVGAVATVLLYQAIPQM